jgi:hypothetical protein
VGLSVIAAAALIVLAYWGAKAEIRERENHKRILDLSSNLSQRPRPHKPRTRRRTSLWPSVAWKRTTN